MAPKWLQNGSLEASGRPLGPTLLPDAPRSRPGEALARPGASQKIHLGGLGTPLERKVDRFRPPGGSPGGSRRGSGRSFGELFGGCAGGNDKKAEKSPKSLFCWSCFCMRFLTAPVCVLFASALAGAKAQLKNMLKTIGFYNIICVCAVCARSANILQTERKSNKKLSKCKRKTPCHGSSKKKQKSTVWGAKMSPKIDPGGLRERLGRLLRATSAPRALQKRSWRPPGAEKETWELPRAPLGEISNEISKKVASGGHRSAALARPVKAYPGGFRPGKS